MDSGPDAFANFVRRKTDAAIRATTPPYVTVFVAPQPSGLAIGNAWTRSKFDGPFYVSSRPLAQRPACSLVFVQSLSGNTGTTDPSSLGGGETDKHVIYEGLSRVAADAVLTGAETIRGNGTIFSVWHPELVALRRSLGLPRHPIQIVATRRGMALERGLTFNVPDAPVIILTVAEGAAAMERALRDRPWVRVIVMPQPDDLAPAVSGLRAWGLHHISCVGGRRLATQLLDQGLVDDVYLTTSPVEGGQPHTPLYPRPLPGHVVVRKRGTASEAGVIFDHVCLNGKTSLR